MAAKSELESYLQGDSGVKAARKKLDSAGAKLAEAKKTLSSTPANASSDTVASIKAAVEKARSEYAKAKEAANAKEATVKEYFNKNYDTIVNKDTDASIAALEKQLKTVPTADAAEAIRASIQDLKDKKNHVGKYAPQAAGSNDGTTSATGDGSQKTVEQKPEDFAGLLKTAPQFIRKMSEPDRKLLAASLNEAFGSKIPVVGVYTDALLGGYQAAISGAQAAYNTFKDVFSVDQYLQQKKAETAQIKAAGGAGGPSLTQYPVISSKSDAKALFNKVFQSELNRDATAAEISKLTPLLNAAQAANPESTKSTKINGKKVLERTSGLNTEQWVIDQLNKDTKLKAELDKFNLTSPDLAKRLADKKTYDAAIAAAGNNPAKIAEIKATTSYGRGIKEFENGIAQIAFEQGATNTPEEIAAIAKALYDKGIAPTGSTFKTEVNTALKFGADKIGKYTGKAGETFADLATTAAANGLDLQKAFGSNLPNWIGAVEKGESIDTFKRIIRDQAKIGMPEKIGKLLDQGVDLETIYTPYKNLMASTLEINPKTITLNDPTLRTAITADAEVPLYQFERALRKDNRWQYTNQAKNEVSSAAQQVLKDFGFMG